MNRVLFLAFSLLALAANADSPLYGKHYPNGNNAANYLYGSEGMWRAVTGLVYNYNRYTQCDTSSHPTNVTLWKADAQAGNTTAGDGYCVLLWDMNGNGEILDDTPSGNALFEHNGFGIDPQDGTYKQIMPPLYNFWFDDNWLARYFAQAYGKSLPSGLHATACNEIVRWRILDGDNNCWTLYSINDTAPDRRALNGLYYVNNDDVFDAYSYWAAILNDSGATWNASDQRYDYPNITETYHLGLWLMLSERILRHVAYADVLQHAMSIRSQLLSMTIRRTPGGQRLGWRTGITQPGVDNLTVINVETQSIVALSLGSEATYVFEAGITPMIKGTGNYFLRPHNVLSAVVGLSSPGHMTYGPYWTLPAGTYDVDFSLRVPGTGGNVATVDVYDGTSILAMSTVAASSLPAGQWVRQRVTATVGATNTTEFRVWWYGSQNLDIGSIRVRQR